MNYLDIETIYKKLEELNKKLELYNTGLSIEDELAFVLSGNYVSEEQMQQILQGNY